jgi:glycosidase
MTRVTENSVFYHIYPLGALGAPKENDRAAPPTHRIDGLHDWISLVRQVGADALYLGPVFESERHGYDTVDYRTVDRRLGTNEDLSRFSRSLADRGIALVLDAVFNHVGRSHPIVRDVAERGRASPYASWIAGYADGGIGRGGLPFAYEGWKGHFDLVKLDTARDEVREHLIDVALGWIEEFDIAGLRLDAADCLDYDFMRLLGERCRRRRPGFYLLGEAVQGDSYAPLMWRGGLDSVTNYEAYKGLWSSYNDGNYHEIAWTLDRLFGENGLTTGRRLYSFADNHDVDRVASTVTERSGLYPLYALLFSMPGNPSIYYGSEFAVLGRKAPGDDGPLRPYLEPSMISREGDRDLAAAIARFSKARARSRALAEGSYKKLAVHDRGLAFLRSFGGEEVVVAVNGSGCERRFEIFEGKLAGKTLSDLLDPAFRAYVSASGHATISVPPHWTRWLSSTETSGEEQ